MKRLKKAAGMMLGVLILASCENGTNRKFKEELKIFKDNPVTINWKTSETEEMESFKADVTVYSKNSRKNSNAKVSHSYRIATRKENGVIFSRVDFPKGQLGEKNRILLQNDREIVIADAESGQVELRLPCNNKIEELDYLTGNMIYGRMNVGKIREISRKLNFDVTEDNKEEMTISLPYQYFADLGNYGRVSTKVKFDTLDEILTEIETIDIDLEGNTVTTTIMPVYEEYNGEMVKVGQISIVDTKMAKLIEGLEGVEYFNSIDEIPETTKEEYEKAKSKGQAFDVNNMRYGNPADLSNIETIIEVYENISINDCDKNEFKLLEEGR